MRALTAVLLALVAGCPGGGSAPDAGPIDAGLDAAWPGSATFTVDVAPFTIHPAGVGEHVAFPDVLRLPDGHLLLAYRVAASHNVDVTGRIVGQVGEQDGVTWSDPTTLLDVAGVDDRDPSLTLLPSGEIGLSYFQYVLQSTTDGTMAVHQVFLARSPADVIAFGDPALVPPGGAMDYPGAHLASALWVDADGAPVIVQACSSPIARAGARLLLPAYGGQSWNSANAASPRSRLTLFASDDGGATWSAQPVAPEAATDVWLQEPSLLVLDDNRFLVHLRTATGDSPGNAGPLEQTRTGDGGATWEAYTAFPFIGHAPYLYRLSSGVILSAFRELNADMSQANVSFIYSLDEGGTWSDPIRILPWVAADLGYPSIRELDDGRVLIVFYTGGTAISAVIYDVTVT